MRSDRSREGHQEQGTNDSGWNGGSLTFDSSEVIEETVNQIDPFPFPSQNKHTVSACVLSFNVTYDGSL